MSIIRTSWIIMAIIISLFTNSISAQSSQSSQSLGPSLIFNEVYRDVNQTNTFIEIVILDPKARAMDPQSDVPQIIVDDSNTIDVQPGFISIKEEAFEGARAGDIIVIHNGGLQVPAGPGVKFINVNSDEVTKHLNVPNANNPNYEGSDISNNPADKIEDFISFGGQGDIVQLRVGERLINKMELTQRDNQSLSSNDISTAMELPAMELPASPGAANNALNAELINNLKSNQELDLSCENYQDVQIQLQYDGGTSPYSVGINNTYTSTPYEGYVKNNPECGVYDITVIDAEGKKGHCQIIIGLPDKIVKEFCESDIYSGLHLSQLLCGEFGEYCGQYQINDETPVRFDQLSNTETLLISDDTDIIVSLSDKFGHILREINITIDVKFENESCDDGDSCTRDDKYVNCECVGTPTSIIEIVKTPAADFSCEEPKYVFSATQEFERYRWFVDGVSRGYESTLTTSHSGLVRLFAVDEFGCKYETTYYQMSPFDINEDLIIASDNMICGEIEVTLSLPDGIEIREWQNDEFEKISEEDQVTVHSAGTYYAFVKDEYCENYLASIVISTAYPEVEILPQLPILCGNSVEIYLDNLPDNANIIKWSNGELDPSIEVNQSGTYSVSVTISEEGEDCTIVLETKVSDKETVDVQSFMAANGFSAFQVEITGITSVKPDQSDDSRKNLNQECSILNLSNKDYQINVLNDEFSGDLIDFIEEISGNACDCHSNPEILVMNDPCDNHPEGLEYLASHTGAMQFYLDHAELGQSTYLYFKQENKIIYGSADPEKFNKVINGIICGRLNDDDVYLDHEYKRISLWLGSDNQLIDNVQYNDFNSFSNGALIQNYVQGGYIEPNNLQFTSRDEITVFKRFYYPMGAYVRTVLRKSTQSDITNIKIPYTDEALPCLEIFISDDNLSDILSLIYLDEDCQIIQDLITQAIGANGGAGDPKVLEKIPPCFLNCSDNNEPILCNILTDFNVLIPVTGYSEAIFNILSTNNPEQAKCIIQCFDENKLVKPFNERLFEDRDDQIRCLGELTRLYYLNYEEPSKNDYKNEAYFRLEGERVYLHGHQYSHSLEESYCLATSTIGSGFTNTTGVYQVHQIPGDSKEFEYFKLFPIRLDNNFEFLGQYKGARDAYLFNPDVPNLKQRANFNVPGVYIPYAILNREKKEDEQDRRILLHTVGFYAGFFTFANGLQLTRLSSLQAALGVTEMGLAVGNMILDESDFCENLDNQELVSFCELYRDVLAPIGDIICVGGAFIGSKVASIETIQSHFSKLKLSDQTKMLDRIEDRYKSIDPDIRTKAYKLFTEPPCLWCRLKESLSDDITGVLDDNFLKNLTSKIGDNATVKLIDLKFVIDDLDSDIAIRFLRDIDQTAGAAGKLGGEVVNLSERTVKAWRVFDKHRDALATDFATLKRMSNDLRSNPNLEAYLDAVDNLENWKSVQFVTNKSFDTKFLDWNKVFQNWTSGNGKNLHHHIFKGSTGGSNGISGVHHVDALTSNTSNFSKGDIRITPGTKTPKGNGFYEAEIEYWDGSKWIQKTENGVPVKNGFFPDNWTQKQIMEEISYARSKVEVSNWAPPLPPNTTSNSYRTTLNSGEEVIFYIGQATSSPPANVGNYTITVFPVF